MITENMIEAGKKAYWGHYKEGPDCFTDQIKAVYEAMNDQKQSDAIKSIQECNAGL